ncbi:uncharacterized protein LOC116105614 [Pistacia vera]|uniref:uncharacterized protein LOC116105614 n=1 Tax=Pistacia vera TaxID=55513 RepID=UPI0012632B3B|nr:uncharacterized protein LOC116105614 [Pistacia vera]
MDELIGSLLTFEMKRTPKEEESKPKREIALKTINEEEEDDSSMEEDETNFLAKRFTKFLARNKRFKGRSFQKFKARNDEDKGKSEIICHECKKLGHIRQDCPQIKWKKKDKKDKQYKKKVLAATWIGNDDSSEKRFK